MAAKCRATATRWKPCRASAARPRMWCSTSPSASRPSRSTPICFRVGNRTGLAPGKTPGGRARLERRICPIMQHHAHHWLILHGRYVCMARNPKCPQCVIEDICLFPARRPWRDAFSCASVGCAPLTGLTKARPSAWLARIRASAGNTIWPGGRRRRSTAGGRMSQPLLLQVPPCRGPVRGRPATKCRSTGVRGVSQGKVQ